MFWGLILEPNNRYSQTVETSFHVSMASLDHQTAEDNAVQVMVNYENRNYLLCTLKKNLAWQVPLDLNFEKGTKISFICNGRGHIHLTGYTLPLNELSFDDMDEEEGDEEEEEEEEVPQLVSKQSKRKAASGLKDEKKIKRVKQVDTESSEEDCCTDELEDNSDDDKDDIDDIEDEEEEEVKPQQKNKNKQALHQQEQKKKEDGKKLANGKETKPDQQTKQQKKNKEQQQQKNAQNNSPPEQRKKTEEGGVVVEDLKVGNGAFAKAGKFIGVYYVGRLKNGKKFDAVMQGDGFKFRLGKGEVIKGWDVGINGMRAGGKRRITIPAPMAYGTKGSPPTIPANSTLIFDVELRNVY